MRGISDQAGLLRSMMYICILCACPALIRCNSKAREEAERRRLLVADSIMQVLTRDSLQCESFRHELQPRLTILDQPSIEGTEGDSFRLIAEFSWGKSPVGPMMSILMQSGEKAPTLTVHSYPGGKLLETTRQASDFEFANLTKIFEGVDFEHQPVYLDVQLTRLDANKYFIERVAEGRYHGIVRSDSVDQFVYDLFAEASTLAQLDTLLIGEFRRLSGHAGPSH